MPATDERTDPLLGFRFTLRVDGQTIGGFSEVSGIQAEVDVLEIQEGGQNSFVHKLPGRVKHGNLTLRRGLATQDLWDWFAELLEGRVRRRTVAVELLPETGDVPSKRWIYESAFPCRWNGPDLKADQSAVAIESVELCHHGFRAESE